MMESLKQARYYVLFIELNYASFAEAQAKARDDIVAHVTRSKQLHEQGKIVMAGAFLDRPEEPLSTMAVCVSPEAAEDYIHGDPFFIKGMVSNWYVREWANMFM